MAGADARRMIDVPSLRAVGTVEETATKILAPISRRLEGQNSRIVCSAVIPIRRAEQGASLGPGRRVEWIAALVREQAELVASRAAVAGREGKEGLAVVIQRCWGLINSKPVHLPGLHRYRELVPRTDAAGGVERGDAETLQVAGDARPDEVVLVVQVEDRAVYAELVWREGRQETVVVPRRRAAYAVVSYLYCGVTSARGGLTLENLGLLGVAASTTRPCCEVKMPPVLC